MTDLTTLSHQELAEHTQAVLGEIESRLVADGNHPRALRLVKGAHDLLDAASQRLAGGGVITPMSGGEPKV